MNKIILIILSLLCGISAQSQTYWDTSRPRQRLTLGLRAGVNFSKQNNGNDGADNDFRTSFQGGVAVDLNIIRSFSVNTGVLYIQKGYKTEYSDYRGTLKTNDNASYIEIPLLASYRIALSESSQFQFNLGPYFAYGIGGKQKVKSTFSGQNDYEIDSFDKLDGMKHFDTGISIGAAATFSKMYVGVNYERSLRNVTNVPTEKFQNGTIAINLGYNFN